MNSSTGGMRKWREKDWTWNLVTALALALAVVFGLLAWRHTDDFDRAFDAMVGGLRVTVMDLNGNVVSDTTGAVLGDHSRREEFLAALRTGSGTAVRRSDTTGREMAYSARQVGGSIIRCAIPFDAMLSLRRLDRLGSAIAAGAMFFFAVFLVVAFIRIRRRFAVLAADRAATRRRLEEAERMAKFRRDFAADFSHELRTPLAALLGAAELLGTSGRLSDDNRRRLSETVVSGARRLDALAGDVLALAELERVSASGDPMTDETCDLSATVAGVVAAFADEARRAGAELTVETEPGVLAHARTRLVERAVSNLVVNAIRHAEAKRIRVKVCRDGAVGCVTVTDDGIGIAAEHLPRLFERFYRPDRSRSRERGGTGLGLAIVKHAVEACGGDVTVESTVGGGTTFRMRIPEAVEVKGNSHA